MKRPFLEAVQQSAQSLLCCADDFAVMKLAVDELYRVFSEITGVTIDQLNRDTDIMLPSGKAISTAAAAHCLLEMKRTALFLRGIHKAITLKILESTGGPIRILYPGTGPFGTLVVPLLSFYSPVDLIVDLLDINPDSLIAVKKTIDALGLESYVGEVCCADATTFTVTKHYDIVICEAMLACLKSEPQVAIMQNLVPQLDPACIFIPEEISIDAYLTNPKMEMERLMYYENGAPLFQRKLLGNIFKVSKSELNSIQTRKTISIPDDISSFPVLKLFTTINIFDDQMLSDNDSSITLPKQYYDFRKQRAEQVEFWYVQGGKPRIESRVVNQTTLHEFINS
jgi:hypothetical protein